MDSATDANPCNLRASTISVFMTFEVSVRRIPEPLMLLISASAASFEDEDVEIAEDSLDAKLPTVIPSPSLIEAILFDASCTARSIWAEPPKWFAGAHVAAWDPAAFPDTKSSRRMFPGRG